MTTVCLVGDPTVTLAYELLSRETAREALSTYEIEEPFENALAVETVSLGAAVSLCNDLKWYRDRFVAESLVRDPSIDADEWLSADLAGLVRDGDVPPEETDRRLKIFGVRDGELVDPEYVLREQGTVPERDRDDLEGTVVVRVTEAEFST
ncbi:DUF5804 family protein [Halopenitus sp. H-Gu1]|uniref:DUF5804 family protein n=1 Tax=Halopenitus sp. H-Gu1 TaxID=3242697 RepID=UPI00359DA396